MKKNILGYTAPEVSVFEVAAERGYQNSLTGPTFGLPGFESDEDTLTF